MPNLADSLAEDLAEDLALDLASVWGRIASLPNLVAAWDPARNYTLDTGVATLASVVNSAHVVSMGTGSQQPTRVVGSCPSGAWALRFDDAASQYLEGAIAAVAGIADTSDCALVFAGRIDSATVNLTAFSFGDADGNNRLRIRTAATDRFDFQEWDGVTAVSAQSAETVAVGEDTWVFGRLLSDTDRRCLTRGGVETQQTSSVTSSGFDTVTLGAKNENASVAFYFSGDIYAWLAFDTSSVDMDAVGALLDELMGIG